MTKSVKSVKEALVVIRIEEPITVVQSWKNFLDHLGTKFLEPYGGRNMLVKVAY